MEREVLLRVVRESSPDKVTFKQETKRKIQGKACSYLGQEHSRKRAGRYRALGRICSLTLTLLEPRWPQSLCCCAHSLPMTSFMRTKIKVLRNERLCLFKIPALLPPDTPVFSSSEEGFQRLLLMVSTDLLSPHGAKEAELSITLPAASPTLRLALRGTWLLPKLSWLTFFLQIVRELPHLTQISLKVAARKTSEPIGAGSPASLGLGL